MIRYLVRRSALLVATGVAGLIAIFVLLRLLPGDPANALLTSTATPEQIEAARRQVGSDQPVLTQFVRWISDLAHGDLGTSFTSGTSVGAEIASRLSVTIPLTLIAFTFALIIAIPLGYVAARWRNGPAGLIVSIFSQVGIAVPVFWIAMMAVIVFAVRLRLVPASGFPPQGWGTPFLAWTALVLPVSTIAFVSSASMTRYTRSAALDVIDSGYMACARALGQSRTRAMIRHGLRNASIPVISVASIELATTFIGAVVVEQVFALPGLGSMLTRAIAQHDFPSIQGVLLVSTALVLVIGFLADVLQRIVDPRLRTSLTGGRA